jgi:hypothetical protein
LFIGHYSVSYISKRIEPLLPLWLLFLAVQFVDIIWSLFIFTGIEEATISHEVPGTPLNLLYMPYSHSLVGSLFWSGIAFIAIRYLPILKSRNFKKALIVSIAVFSHWLLDLIVHTADLPLWMNTYKVGFGLYEHAMMSFLLEVVVLIVGFIFYMIYSRKDTKGKYGMYIFVILVILFGINSVWGVSPPNSQVAAGFLLFCYLLFAVNIGWLEKRRRT